MIYYRSEQTSRNRFFKEIKPGDILVSKYVWLVLVVLCFGGCYYDCLVLHEGKVIKTSVNVLYLI